MFSGRSQEIAIQVHPRCSEYVNECKYTLHLWRSRAVTQKAEMALGRKIRQKIEEAKTFYEKGQSKQVLLEGNQKVLAIFGGDRWPTWEQVCRLKQKYWEPEESAVQFNICQSFDLNEEHLMILWDARDFDLPPKDLV